MARPIDLDQLMKYPLRRESAICDEEHADPHFLNGVESVLEWAQTLPTLTPPNEPLSILVLDEPDREYIDYICPKCKNTISQRRRGQLMRDVYQCKYHDNCGQRVDWNNPQLYHIPSADKMKDCPPEGEEDTK